ncbi:hypothetical protein EIN_344650 [Entamoeba invadens IP1]|uniref:Uncharacterized protein n=1 Tax=Entamoeba invadens IP1 TaxID=370355 RepID=A0A0A1U6N5_ENTIV|nr:hypothetical protein EIN_344650 [Entamoeba invadens IP1]ELP88515.1 hypothetical protein EIN_344650 [Entamoeba invadens IP1]|eukprot:XP_004255286.1 hypothetical protein EIN_344650 [Entamoeba invadens IP1]
MPHIFQGSIENATTFVELFRVFKKLEAETLSILFSTDGVYFKVGSQEAILSVAVEKEYFSHFVSSRNVVAVIKKAFLCDFLCSVSGVGSSLNITLTGETIKLTTIRPNNIKVSSKLNITYATNDLTLLEPKTRADATIAFATKDLISIIKTVSRLNQQTTTFKSKSDGSLEVIGSPTDVFKKSVQYFPGISSRKAVETKVMTDTLLKVVGPYLDEARLYLTKGESLRIQYRDALISIIIEVAEATD